jgi:hypothetical protein
VEEGWRVLDEVAYGRIGYRGPSGRNGWWTVHQTQGAALG